jgi:hypothetical protein
MSAFGGKADMTRTAEMSAFDPKRTLAWMAAIRIVVPEAVLEQREWSQRY